MKWTLAKIFVLILVVSVGIGLFLVSYQIFKSLTSGRDLFLFQDVQIALLQNNTQVACSRLQQIEEKICGIEKGKGKRNLTAFEGKRIVQVPAVNQEGKGVVANISVSVEPGEGRVLFDLQNVLEFYDTQDSARTALEVAKQITERNLEGKDVIYSIRAPAPVVRGPSAGAAMAVATIAAIENKTINQSVMMTGQINHDGTIGLVSEIEAKAEAAKEQGATLFLVPLRQSEEVTYEERKHCKEFNGFEYCNIEYVPIRKNLTEIAGIRVEEVGHISEAVDLMSY